MPRYACAALLAFSALCTPVAAEPFCLSVTFTGIPREFVTPVVLCLPVNAFCDEVEVDASGQAGVIVVICLPTGPAG